GPSRPRPYAAGLLLTTGYYPKWKKPVISAAVTSLLASDLHNFLPHPPLTHCAPMNTTRTSHKPSVWPPPIRRILTAPHWTGPPPKAIVPGEKPARSEERRVGKECGAAW